MHPAAVDPEATQDTPRWFVVCGDDSLAFRLTEELSVRHNGQVTVILRSRHENFGPRIAKHTITDVWMSPFPSYEDMELKN